MNYHDFSRSNGMPRKRSTFALPFRHKFTLSCGGLYPFYCEEVLPGDTFQNKTSFIVRNLQNMVHPVVDDAYVDVYWFFVPNRILWKKWEQFCGVAEPSEYLANSSLEIPHVSNNDSVVPGSLADALGVPVGLNPSGNTKINVLPFAGYMKIWNDWFRDESLQNSFSSLDTLYNASSGAGFAVPLFFINGVVGSSEYTSVNKYHDLFTSCLPNAQKGAAVKLPLGLVAPLTVDTNVGAPSTPYNMDPNNDGVVLSPVNNGTNAGALFDSGLGLVANGSGTTGTTSPVKYTNIVADLSNATSATINQLRQAIALQVYFEKLALGGSRYTELLKAMFGVAPTDARLDRPEYLGGSHQRLNAQQVASTAGTGTPGTPSNTDTGSLGAYSVTTNSSRDFVKSFEEFGLLFGLMAIRVKHTYAQGVRKHFLKNTRFDYYWPQLDRMGEVPVSVKEIYHSGSGTFGFQEAWYEYRHTPDRCSGLINPSVSGFADFAAWTYTDNYAAAPTLSSGWIKEDRTRVDQTLAGNNQYPQFLVDVYCDMKATRPMSLNSVPNSFGM